MTNNIAEIIFLNSLEAMKEILDLGEYKLGNNSKDYEYFKRRVMDIVYSRLNKTLKRLEEKELIVKCSCSANLRHGYTKCPMCHGAGYMNKEIKIDSGKVKNVK